MLRVVRPRYTLPSGDSSGDMEGVCVMAKGGSFDFREIKKLQKQIERLEQERDAFNRGMHPGISLPPAEESYAENTGRQGS